MRRDTARGTLVAQRQALLDAKAMLFVDDCQAQIAELHVVLEQRVSADNHHRLAAGDQLQLVAARLALQFAGDPGH